MRIKETEGQDELRDAEGMFTSKALDRMFEKQEWICPIQYDKQGRLVSVTLETNSDEGKEKNIITYKYSENLIEAQSTGNQKATSTFYLKNGKITK